MRTLIFGTSYIADASALWVARQWLNLARTLSPEADLLMVDSASPVALPDGVEVLQLGDNIGHLSRGGRDGWGRAFCVGLERARGYDFAVHIECDLLFVRPVSQMIERMQKASVVVAAPWAMPYLYVETALMFMDMGYADAPYGWPAKYDWAGGIGQPELRMEKLLGDDLFIAPLRGTRDDLGNAVPEGMDYLTHAKIGKYRALLRSAGVEEAK